MQGESIIGWLRTRFVGSVCTSAAGAAILSALSWNRALLPSGVLAACAVQLYVQLYCTVVSAVFFVIYIHAFPCSFGMWDGPLRCDFSYRPVSCWCPARLL